MVRRLNERYGNGAVNSNGFDVHIGDLIIEVETSATIREAIEKLKRAEGRCYIAVDALAPARGFAFWAEGDTLHARVPLTA